jgi:hypothetical protein
MMSAGWDAHPWEGWGWTTAMKVLAVERTQSLWPEAGVPAAIRVWPEPVVHVARAFVRTFKSSEIPSTSIGAAWDATRQLLVEAFEQLEDKYGREEAEALWRWAHEGFVTQDRFLWFSWQTVFRRLSDAREDRRSEPLPRMAPDRLERVLTDIAGRFSRSADEERTARYRAAEEFPIAADEADLVALEVTKPDDDREFDVSAAISNAAENQVARDLWAQLDVWLEPQERQELLRWAHEQVGPLLPDVARLKLPPWRKATT